MAKQIFRHKQGLSDPQIMHPYRDWYIGLFVTVLLFSGSAYWSAYSYMKNKNVTDIQPVNQSGEVVVYRESQVTAALQKILEREQALANLLGSVVPTEPLITESATTSAATSTIPAQASEPVTSIPSETPAEDSPSSVLFEAS